ncbi:MAG TPA: hypothetical protein VGF23_02425 [Gaiellaceae bacterium]|jgi:hypothetical protein
MDVRLQLDTGELLDLDDRDAGRLYEALWSSRPGMQGVASAAGKVGRARRSKGPDAESLDEHESAAVRDALARLGPE